MKKLRRFCILGILVLTLGGCNNRPISISENVEKIPDFPQYYEKTIDKVIFETNIYLPKEMNNLLTRAKIRLIKPDKEKIREILTDGWEEKEVKELFDDKGKDGELDFYHILTNDNYSLTISKGIFYSTPNGYFYDNTLQYNENDELSNMYMQVDELEDFTRRGCEKKVEELLKQIGVTVSDMEQEIFALTHESLKKTEEQTEYDENVRTDYYKETWTREDDAYLFLMRQKYEGIPVAYSYIYPDYTHRNAPVQILWSRRGIEYLNINYFFSFDVTDEILTLKAFDEIAETVETKMNKILTDAVYKVTSASIYQLIQQQKNEDAYTMSPAWILEIEEDTGEDIYTFEMFVDAVTGKEVIL